MTECAAVVRYLRLFSNKYIIILFYTESGKLRSLDFVCFILDFFLIATILVFSI